MSMTIINFMPVYEQAPVSLRLLAEDVAGMGSALAALATGGDQLVVMLPKSEGRLADELRRESGLGEDRLRIALEDASFGFVYANATAAERVAAGQKPIPSGLSSQAHATLVSGERLLGDETKRIWLDGAAAPVEVARTASVADILAASGVDGTDAKAVYLGYPMGVFVTPDHFPDPVELTCDFAKVLGPSSCAAAALHQIAERYRRETCGHCVFGHEGSYQISAVLSDVVSKRGKADDLALLADLCPVMREQSLCEVGRVMAATCAQALDLFGDEISAHIARKTCPSGECAAFMTYHILPTKCVGCGDCADACEEEAILGKPRWVHVIDQKACTQCGACLEACEEGAIVRAGADKPRTPPRPIPVRK